MKFEFDINEINSILAVLSRQPYADVAGIIMKINQQAQPQLMPKPKKTKAVKDAV